MTPNTSVPGAYTKMRAQDFTVTQLLGVGGIGEVHMAKHTPSGKFYALKRIRRADICKREMVHHVLSEVCLLGTLHHPSVVHMFDVVQDRRNVFLVMQCCVGGELYARMIHPVTHEWHSMPPQAAQFYFAELAVGLRYLHEEAGVCFRDLKPENVLLDDEGHIRITDFGFARRLAPGDSFNASSKRVGTVQYCAPEIVGTDAYSRSGYGHEIDWWALGCMLYEMLVGVSPFGDVNETSKDAIVRNILRADTSLNLRLESHLKHEAGLADLLRGLLRVDRRSRWSFKDVQRCQWMAGINWEAVRQHRLRPPFVPGRRGAGDATFFPHPGQARSVETGKLLPAELAYSDVAACIQTA